MWASLASGWKIGHRDGGRGPGNAHGMKREDALGTEFWTLTFKTGSMCEKQARGPSGKTV